VVLSKAQKAYHASLEGKAIDRGIPGKEVLWLPPHRSVRDVLGKQNPFDEFGAEWTVEDVTQFLFPKKYREKQFEIASKFLVLLLSTPELNSRQLAPFIRQNKFSKATFYNRVLPRLKDAGLVEAKRELSDAGPSKKGRLRLRASLSFHNYLFKLAKEWRRMVLSARARFESQQTQESQENAVEVL